MRLQGAFVVKSRYEELIEQKWKSTIISTCCPTVVKLIQRHYPEVIKNLAPVLSPMQVHAKLIKQRHPDALVVFIGPCISKKDECQRYPGMADYVLTFEELNEWFDEKEINLSDSTEDAGTRCLSRFFPVSGGIIKTMNIHTDYSYIAVDEMENCINAIKEISQGKLENCFIEMSACKGSCVKGPIAGKHKVPMITSQIKIAEFATDKNKASDYDIKPNFDLAQKVKNEQIIFQPPDEAQISAILKKIGKNSIADELNCGTCGYSSCRGKAIAVYFGKAEISMCLPYMKERAESFSDIIINATPNSIITVDSNLNIYQINNSACKIFGINDPHDLISAPVSRIMDEFDFANAFVTEEHTKKQQTKSLSLYACPRSFL